MKRWLAAPLGLLLLAPAGAQAADYLPGRVIVQYEPGANASERADAREDAGVRRLDSIGLARTEVVKVTDGESVPATVAELRREPGVAIATPDAVGHDFAIPNDPNFPRLWGLRNIGQDANLFSADETTDGFPSIAPVAGRDINAATAWNTTTGSDAVVVAVIDGGFHYQLPDIAPQVWKNPGETGGGRETDNVDNDGNGEVDDWQGFDFIGATFNAPSADDDPFDENFHGTHVAGTVGARGNDGVGVTGVAQRVRLLNVRHTDAVGSAALSSTVNALDYAGDMGADVANGSFGFNGNPATTSLFNQVIAAHPGTLYVVAAGNGGPDGSGDNLDAGSSGQNEAAPCEATAANIICVAATDQADQIASFSNFGASSVDLGAPGVDILSNWARATHFSPAMTSAAGFNVDWPSLGTGWSRTTANPFDTPDGGAITDSPAGNYAPNSSNVATSRAFTVPAGATGCELSYFRKVAIAAGDSGFIVVLKDNAIHDFVSAPNGARNSSFEIASGLGGSSNVRVQLQLLADPDASTADGMSLASVRLDCDPRKGQAGGFAYIDGTSMATPHVSGAAALLLAKNPGLSVAQLRTALLSTGDPTPSMVGRTVTGRRLDIAAAVNSVPFPAPPARVIPLGFSKLRKTLQLSRNGTVTITVTGAPGTAGSMVLKTRKKIAIAAGKKKRKKKKVLVLARKKFKIRANGRVKVKLKVKGRALRTLKKAKRLKAVVEIKSGALRATKKVTVKAPKKQKKKKRKRR